MRSLILTTILLACFFGFSAATNEREKRPIDEIGSSEAPSSNQKKAREHISTQLSLSSGASSSSGTSKKITLFVNESIRKIEKFEKFKLICTKDSLMILKAKLMRHQASMDLVVHFMKKCESEFSNWFKNRMKRVHFIAYSVNLWVSSVERFIFVRNGIYRSYYSR